MSEKQRELSMMYDRNEYLKSIAWSLDRLIKLRYLSMSGVMGSKDKSDEIEKIGDELFK